MNTYELLADAVLIAHVSIVAFIVVGLPIVWIGNLLDWRFVNGWLFRLVHLVAIAIVVAQAWFGVICPLTTLESWLRIQGGGTGYGESFIAHWLQAILFYDAPLWVFTLAYTLFGLAVLATWWRYPPRRIRLSQLRSSRSSNSATDRASKRSARSERVDSDAF